MGSDPFRADVVVPDIEVEPRHAKIFRDPRGEHVLKDPGTGKGTIVNNKGLESERALSDGDRITLSDSVLEFSRGDPVRANFHGARHRLISRDYLTDLLVKNRFDKEFEHHLGSAGERPLSVLVTDIDNLNKVKTTPTATSSASTSSERSGTSSASCTKKAAARPPASAATSTRPSCLDSPKKRLSRSPRK